MLIKFNRIKHQIHEQRRKNLQDQIKIRQMARMFESDADRQQRLALEQLRSQDWK